MDNVGRKGLAYHAAPAVAVAALLAGLISLVLFVLNRHTPVPASWGADGGPRTDPAAWFNALQSAVVLPLLTGTLGVLIVRRNVARRIGLLLLVISLFIGVQTSITEYAVYGAYTAARPLPGTYLAAWLGNFIWVFLFDCILLLLAIFPDTRFASPRWKMAILTPLVVTNVGLVVGAILESPMTSAYQIPNPFVQQTPETIYNTLFSIGVGGLLTTILVIFGSVLRRFRTAVGRTRQQMKWLLAGVAGLVILNLTGLSLAFGLDVAVGGILVNVSLLAPVLGIGVALVRHRLYDIDVIIRRTLLYTATSAALALVYFGSVLLLQAAFSVFTPRSPIAIVLSTLLSAALFNPLRSRIQTIIDRRFYRQKYDAARILTAFAAAARDEVELERLEAAMVETVQRTVRPAHVQLWIRKPRR